MSRTRLGLADDMWTAALLAHDADVRAVVRAWVADWHAAEDVVQDTYAEALRHRDTYDPSYPVLPWLLQIARHAVIRRWRTDQGIETVALDALVDRPELGLHEAGSDEHVALLETRNALCAAVGRLTKRQQRWMWRWEFERRSTAQLAASENVTPGALRQGVKRAWSSARDGFLEAGGERPTPVLVPVVGGALARLRARWSRAAAEGWPDVLAVCAVPAVAAGLLLGVWPVPTPGGPDNFPRPAPERPAAVVTTAPTTTAAPPADETPFPAASKPSPLVPRATPAPPPAPPPPPDERIKNGVDVDVPGAQSENVLVVEIYCNTGIVTAMACAVMPD